MPEGSVTASPGAYYTDIAATNGAVRWVKASGAGTAGWRVVYGDTGWRNVESLFQSVCAANGLTYARKAGFDAPRIRRINDVVYFNVGLVITGTPTNLNNADFRPALGGTVPGLSIDIDNWQIPASVTGSAGVVHWSTVWVRFWSPGDVLLTLSRPSRVGTWPATLPGIPA